MEYFQVVELAPLVNMGLSSFEKYDRDSREIKYLKIHCFHILAKICLVLLADLRKVLKTENENVDPNCLLDMIIYKNT